MLKKAITRNLWQWSEMKSCVILEKSFQLILEGEGDFTTTGGSALEDCWNMQNKFFSFYSLFSSISTFAD